MKLLITGNKGLVGSALYEYFSSKYNTTGIDIDVLDLTNSIEVKNLFEENHFDILINAFGKNDHVGKETKGNRVETISLEEIDEYLRINTVTLFNINRSFLNSNPNGKVFNFSSMYGHHVPSPAFYDGDHKSIGYCISKAGAVMITKYLAVHYPKSEVIDIVLGGVENNQHINFKKNFLKTVPKNRMLNRNEIAPILEGLFNSKYITGTSIFIDGGKNLY